MDVNVGSLGYISELRNNSLHAIKMYYTGCLKKKVIELWSAIAHSLYNLQK